jgi:hypothetical protein
MNTTKLLAVFVENKPGQTARITRVLAQANVNIRWVTIASNGSFGVMKFLVDRCDLGLQSLRDEGLMVSVLQVLAIEVPNTPGALQKIADLLGEKAINLDNCSGFVANDRAILIIEANALKEAHAVLLDAGLRLLTEQEMLSL